MVKRIDYSAQIAAFERIVRAPHGSVARRTVGSMLKRSKHDLIDYKLTRVSDRRRGADTIVAEQRGYQAEKNRFELHGILTEIEKNKCEYENMVVRKCKYTKNSGANE